MRRAVRAVLLTLIVWPCAAWSAVEPVELKVKDAAMLSGMQDGSLSLVLPEFFVFRSSGAAIFHDKGFSGNFMELVELAMKTNTALLSKPSLKKVLAEIVTMDDGPFEADALPNYDFVFVEYWADWCAPCHQQKKVVAEYLAKNRGTKILWLYVRRDPTLLANAAVAKK